MILFVFATCDCFVCLCHVLLFCLSLPCIIVLFVFAVIVLFLFAMYDCFVCLCHVWLFCLSLPCRIVLFVFAMYDCFVCLCHVWSILGAHILYKSYVRWSTYTILTIPGSVCSYFILATSGLLLRFNYIRLPSH